MIASCFTYVDSTTLTQNLVYYTLYFLLTRPSFNPHNFLSYGGLGLEDSSDVQWPGLLAQSSH